jgi:hypothetical protein
VALMAQHPAVEKGGWQNSSSEMAEPKINEKTQRYQCAEDKHCMQGI